MTNTTALRVAALMAAIAVALGAFGAHGFKELLARNNTASIWQTAVFYHFLHAVVLFILAGRSPLQSGPWWCFLVGILLFSGSLYVMAFAKLQWIGPVTPLGGISFIIGWLWLVVAPLAKAGGGA